jgi:hypothetical protein
LDKAREILRVATPDNEVGWVARAQCVSARVIEQEVACAVRADPAPVGAHEPEREPIRRRVCFDMETCDAEVLRQALALLRIQSDLDPSEIEDGALLAAMARTIVQGAESWCASAADLEDDAGGSPGDATDAGDSRGDAPDAGDSPGDATDAGDSRGDAPDAGDSPGDTGGSLSAPASSPRSRLTHVGIERSSTETTCRVAESAEHLARNVPDPPYPDREQNVGAGSIPKSPRCLRPTWNSHANAHFCAQRAHGCTMSPTDDKNLRRWPFARIVESRISTNSVWRAAASSNSA